MRRTSPPRLVVRTSFATLATVAVLLSAVFVVLLLDVRERVHESVVEKLEGGQRMLSALERRRAEDLKLQVETLAENSTLKAALDTYQSEQTTDSAIERAELVATVTRELEKLSSRLRPDVLALSDASGRTVAVAGRRARDWEAGSSGAADAQAATELIALRSGVFRRAIADLVLQDAVLGRLQLAIALDQRYARELSVLSGASVLITARGSLVATTLPSQVSDALPAETLRSLPSAGVIPIASHEYAIRELVRQGDEGVYVLDSIDASAAPALGRALRTIFGIALAAFALAGIASIWLAQTLTRPIDALSRSLAAMTRARAFDDPVAHTGFSLEMDTLTESFNSMMRALRAAETETRSAYVGTIRALAMTLDARDPYTAGHSERVSALSVAVGRQMGLAEDEVDILRLGALLHDIGKIGVSDDVLRKAGPLTPEEYEAIKLHPTLGARILRSVPFLSPHIPIVELHHERPDGAGYPHRLRGDEIPLLARIVHVTDAFDAMTSARAYRPGRPATEALRELWRCAGSQFDAEVVQALANALPSMDLAALGDARPFSTPVRVPRLAVVGAGS